MIEHSITGKVTYHPYVMSNDLSQVVAKELKPKASMSSRYDMTGALAKHGFDHETVMTEFLGKEWRNRNLADLLPAVNGRFGYKALLHQTKVTTGFEIIANLLKDPDETVEKLKLRDRIAESMWSWRDLLIERKRGNESRLIELGGISVAMESFVGIEKAIQNTFVEEEGYMEVPEGTRFSDWPYYVLTVNKKDEEIFVSFRRAVDKPSVDSMLTPSQSSELLTDPESFVRSFRGEIFSYEIGIL